MLRSKPLVLRTLLFALYLFTFSCKQEQTSLYEFDPTKMAENKITLSEIADDISYVPLDNSFQVGIIYNYQITNNSIYLSAKDIGVLKYNKQGKFVSKIGSIGRGPGEYNFCFDFSVDDNRETIYVLDQDILMIYSKSGNFLRSISLKEYGDNISSFELNDSHIFVSFMLQYGVPKNEWIVLDTLGNLVTEKKRTIPEFKTNWLIAGGTYKFNDMVTYWNPFTDTAFAVLPDLTYKASFLLAPGEHRFPKVQFDSFEQFKQYLYINQIFETNQFLVFRYNYKNPIIAVIDKKIGKSYLSILELIKSDIPPEKYLGGIMNDIDGGNQFQPGGTSFRQESYNVENDREYIFGLIEPFKIKSWVAGGEYKNSHPKYPEKKKELEKLAASMKETDNPVLIMVRLKK